MATHSFALADAPSRMASTATSVSTPIPSGTNALHAYQQFSTQSNLSFSEAYITATDHWGNSISVPLNGTEHSKRSLCRRLKALGWQLSNPLTYPAWATLDIESHQHSHLGIDPIKLVNAVLEIQRLLRQNANQMPTQRPPPNSQGQI